MGIKQIIYPHTGIYQRKVRQVELRADAESFKDLAELMASASSKDLLGINRIESEAIEFLNDYVEKDMGGFNEAVRREVESAGLDYVVQNYIGRVRDNLAAEFNKDLSVEERRKITRKLSRLEKAADACDILSLIPGIQLRRKNSPDQMGAFADGLLLGRAHGRFRVRSAEPKALIGDKILKGVSAGGVAARESARRRHQRIVADFRKSGLTQRKYSEKSGGSLRTLKRALKEMGPNLSR